MDKNEFIVAAYKRRPLHLGIRVYSLIIGLSLIVYGLIHYPLNGVMLLIPGTLLVIYSIAGISILKANYCITITQDSILIKRTFKQMIVIELKTIERLVMNFNNLYVQHTDCVRTYNLSWLSIEDHLKLENKLKEITQSRPTSELS